MVRTKQQKAWLAGCWHPFVRISTRYDSASALVCLLCGKEKKIVLFPEEWA